MKGILSVSKKRTKPKLLFRGGEGECENAYQRKGLFWNLKLWASQRGGTYLSINSIKRSFYAQHLSEPQNYLWFTTVYSPENENFPQMKKYWYS